jgi:F-type H+-transporting ATPase subunit delta
MLELLSAVAQDPAMAGLIASPKLDRDQMAELVNEIGGGRLSDEGQNLVKLLAQNDRLAVLPEIATLYEAEKNQHEGALDVHVTTAYVLKPAEEKQLTDALKAKLGRDIKITSEKDPDLIGGIKIRAGDMVIDGSVLGGLKQLANELGI